MRIRILTAALRDLERGRDFYAGQGDAVGEYFLDSLFSDIDSLALYAGVHIQVFGFYRLLAKRFPYAIYYKWKVKSVPFGECLTVGAIRTGFCTNSANDTAGW